jgi:hypothetical protein
MIGSRDPGFTRNHVHYGRLIAIEIGCWWLNRYA